MGSEKPVPVEGLEGIAWTNNPTTSAEAVESKKKFNYTQVLALAISRAQSDRLAESSIRWMQTIYEAKKATSEVDPLLLRDIYFHGIEAGRIWSNEVENSLSIMRRNGILSILSPRYEEMLVEPKAREDILRSYGLKLAAHEEGLSIITGLNEEKLGIKK